MKNRVNVSYGEEFILYFKIKKEDGLKAAKIDSFLKSEVFEFDCEGHEWYYDYHIICESFIDAAKVETFIQTDI